MERRNVNPGTLVLAALLLAGVIAVAVLMPDTLALKRKLDVETNATPTPPPWSAA